MPFERQRQHAGGDLERTPVVLRDPLLLVQVVILVVAVAVVEAVVVAVEVEPLKVQRKKNLIKSAIIL